MSLSEEIFQLPRTKVGSWAMILTPRLLRSRSLLQLWIVNVLHEGHQAFPTLSRQFSDAIPKNSSTSVDALTQGLAFER